jgi:phospholipase/carboxylesterase
MDDALSYIHLFEKGAETDARPLLLLHGTGGDENDLVPLGRMIGPTAPLLSPRGNVLENGMPRFFRRLAEGVFDEDDVRRRAQELADFVEAARVGYRIATPIALGYSNGANIAAAVLLMRPQVLAGAILLRAMAPLSQAAPVDLTGKPILIVSGQRDPIIQPERVAQLVSLLQRYGAAVEHRIPPTGHELSQTDVTLAREWLRAHEHPATQEIEQHAVAAQGGKFGREAATIECSSVRTLREQGGTMSKLTSFESDIRPLFTERDIQAMSKAFNLASHDDVKTHAAAILDRIRGIGGAVMPPPPPKGEGPWAQSRINLFAKWVADGCPP